ELETRTIVGLGLITLVGLGLRLLAWRWHALYPLGGDEREYLSQALTLLGGGGYHELLLMRPPLYAAFLAAAAWLVDSSTQGLRLIQLLLSTLTIPLIYLWARALLNLSVGSTAIMEKPLSLGRRGVEERSTP